MTSYIRWFRDIKLSDLAQVGGKTASPGELYSELGAVGVRVPNGFAITADAYHALLDANGLRERVAALLMGVTGEDVGALATAGAELRRLVETATLPSGLAEDLIAAYRELGRGYGREPAVAVRSSATAEDLPQASFAGQHESYLGVRGDAALLTACRRCFASIFTDRAIVYRIQNGFDHLRVLLSVAVQKMVGEGYYPYYAPARPSTIPRAIRMAPLQTCWSPGHEGIVANRPWRLAAEERVVEESPRTMLPCQQRQQQNHDHDQSRQNRHRPPRRSPWIPARRHLRGPLR